MHTDTRVIEVADFKYEFQICHTTVARSFIGPLPSSYVVRVTFCVQRQRHASACSHSWSLLCRWESPLQRHGGHLDIHEQGNQLYLNWISKIESGKWHQLQISSVMSAVTAPRLWTSSWNMSRIDLNFRLMPCFPAVPCCCTACSLPPMPCWCSK